jgi:hypothetical protein
VKEEGLPENSRNLKSNPQVKCRAKAAPFTFLKPLAFYLSQEPVLVHGVALSKSGDWPEKKHAALPVGQSRRDDFFEKNSRPLVGASRWSGKQKR